jgi:molecular chaperone GrpE
MEEQEEPKNEQVTEQSEQPATGKEASTERASRMDAAKAFFRALNAGDDMQTTGQSADNAQGGACSSCAYMEQQVKEAEQKTTEADFLYKRMAADFENYRKRTDREREEFQSIGMQKIVEALLPALDDMDRAASSLNEETPPAKLLESLKLVYNRITKCMEQLGVKPLVAVGEQFDPKYHEPVQEVETTEFPDGAVVQELRRGYTLNDRVIRPSLVNVASNSQQDASATENLGTAESIITDEQGGKIYDLSDLEQDSEQTDAQRQGAASGD